METNSYGYDNDQIRQAGHHTR